MSTLNSERVAAATIGRSNEVNVLFYLHTGDDWPPCPGETVTARLISPFVVEVTESFCLDMDPRLCCAAGRLFVPPASPSGKTEAARRLI